MHRLPPLFLLILIAVVGHIALTGCRVTTTLYALSMHASRAEIGMLIALFSFFPMMFAVSVGRLVDRIGILQPIAWGATVMAVGCALPRLFDGVAILYPTVILIGAGFLALHVASLHAVGAISTAANRSSHFSWLGTGYSISSFSGPVIAGMVIDHSRHGVAFAVLAVFPLLALTLAWCGRLQRIDLPPAAAASTGSALNLLLDPALRRIYLVGLLLGAAWDLYTFVMPIHGTQLGFTASTIGLILGSFALATLVVRLGMQWMARWFSAWQIMTGALCTAVLCYGLFPLMTSAGGLVAVSIVLGVALGSSQPNMLALLHLHAPVGRAGEAIGIRVTISNASQVLLPLAFGAAGAAVGLAPVFWCVGAIIGTGIPAAWRQARR